MDQSTLLNDVIYGLELLGTVAFAVSGALAAIGKGADLFGVVFIGVTTAVGGGIMRDLIIGVQPPVAFVHYEYVAASAATALLIFTFAYLRLDHYKNRKGLIERYNVAFDAAGLGVFTVIGMNAGIAAGHGDNPFLVIFLGMLTGIGGGILRDTLVREIPLVLRKQVYAVASLAGGLLYYVLYWAGTDRIVCALAGIALIFILRMASARLRWHLPRIPLE